MTPEQIFEQFSKQTVLIVGDVMVDAYWWGDVSRISPEAPVPVVQVGQTENRLGGAANVALNVKALGATPLLCSLIGDDENGRIFKQLLEQSDLSSSGIVADAHRITTVKTRVISGSQHLLRIDHEQTDNINATQSDALELRFLELLPKASVVVFEDYDKGVLHPQLIQKLISHCQKLGVPTAVDPKKANFLAYSGVDLFKPNLKELREGLKIELKDVSVETLSEATAKAREVLGVKNFFITLSERGVFFDDGKQPFIRPAHLRRIADVSGAGDTVISVAALALSLGLPSTQIAELSNLAGGLVCEEIGVVPINKALLKEEAEKFL